MSTQTSLYFAPVASESPRTASPAPSDAQPYLAARLWLLGRLQSGPVSTLELRCPPWHASMNPAERVRELRIANHDIRTERRGRGYWYWLWIDGEPVGQLPGVVDA